MQCNKPCNKKVWRYDFEIEQLILDIENEKFPKCPDCGELIRPNVYMFRPAPPWYLHHTSSISLIFFMLFFKKIA